MSVPKPQMYIYQLPYEERRKLCMILDKQNKWEELGLKQMQYDEISIDSLKREVFQGKSPAHELLTMWGHHNHTVLELFVLLNRMGLYQCMSLLKNFVDHKYHALIKEDKILNKNFNKNIIKCVTKISTASIVESAGATPKISYEELEKATDNWSASRILGQGGFGTVFRGIWKYTQVAIKILKTKNNTRTDLAEQIRQSINELQCLNAYRHDNILPLYGYSIGGQHPCLVYQYMSGGSLDVRLRMKDGQKLLSWTTRLDIAIGTARGLQFLHTTLHDNKPLIHGDIKSANILLDSMDQPRIGDFGLAREGPESHFTHIKVSRIHGTLPYLPNEFLRSKEFSIKIDTYSFGVVLFELATALLASDKRLPSFLKDYVVDFPIENIRELKDKRIANCDFIFTELIRIGKICVEKRAKDRPEMVKVLGLLERVSEGPSKTRLK